MKNNKPQKIFFEVSDKDKKKEFKISVELFKKVKKKEFNEIDQIIINTTQKIHNIYYEK
jgi:uncharacterized protein (UPF0297 family)